MENPGVICEDILEERIRKLTQKLDRAIFEESLEKLRDEIHEMKRDLRSKNEQDN